MRFPWVGLLVLLLVIILVDSFLLIRSLNKGALKNGWLQRMLWSIWYLCIPLTFSGLFAAFFVATPKASSSDFYYYFGWIMVAFLVIYIPKTLWAVGSGALILFKRATSRPELVSETGETVKVPYPRISRRKFVSQVGIIVATAPVVSLLFGVFKGRLAFFTRYRKLSFPNLPASFDGLKIAQISDIHLGGFQHDYSALDEAIEMVNRHHPDIIVFTGDLVNNFHEETIGWERVFNRLKAPMGKFSILGNHDYGYYSKWNSEAAFDNNFNQIVKAHKRLGFKLLRNENIVMNRNEQSLAIAGVEYWGVGMPYPNSGDLNKASQNIDNVPFKVLLSHDPNHWDAEVVSKTSYDLTLAGHTHGMQFGIDYKGLVWSPAKYKFRRWDGLYRHGNQFLFVNRGLGVLGMPARVGMSPEITIIELSRGPVSTEPM
jgi:predicted MPP superfamily phosphohydrolase